MSTKEERAYKEGFENGWILALIRSIGVTAEEAREMLMRVYTEYQPYDEDE